MVDRIVHFALKHRLIVLLAAVALIAGGLVAFKSLPIEAYPDVADTWVQVITQWPGHAAEEVEREITIPIENELNGVPHTTALRSSSIAGLSVVSVVFEDGTDSFFARQQALERLAGVDLPNGVKPKLGPLSSPIGEIMRFELQGAGRPLSELKAIEDWVVERNLRSVPGVADVVSFGGTTKQYQVFLRPGLLVANQLTLGDVTRAIDAANGNAGGGVIRIGSESLNVRGVGLLERPEQIAEIPIAERDGATVRVRDVGRVELGYVPRLGKVGMEDKDDIVAATVLMRKGEQAEDVLARVHERIDELNARTLPRGVKIVPFYDRTRLMEQTKGTVLHNLAEGIGLVSLILVLFLGNLRAALIVALAIPLSLLTAFILMVWRGIPANLLSIGAVDFGMIVDGSVVMVENVFRHLHDARKRGGPVDVLAIVRSAAHEVARPIVFAVLIIVSAYLPIFTLQRVEGKLFSPMAYTVAFALLGALTLAVTFAPVMSSFLLAGNVREFDNPILKGTRKVYFPVLRWALRRPKVWMAIALAIFGIGLAMVKLIGSEFLPHLDEGAVWVRASMPANISLEEAERLTPQFRRILGEYPEVDLVASFLGRPDDGTDAIGFYNCEILVTLKPHGQWRSQFHTKDELIEDMSKKLDVYPGIDFGFSQPISDNVEEALTGVKGQLAIKITGDNLFELDQLATAFAAAIKDEPGVVDLGVFRELGQSNLVVHVDRARAQRYGLTVDDIEDVVETGVGGRVVTEIVEGERRFGVAVRYAPEDRDTFDEVRRLTFRTHDGKIVELGSVADVRVEQGASRIYREGSRRYIGIKFGVRDRDLGSTVDEAQARTKELTRLAESKGFQVSWGGEFESQRRAAKRLAIIVPVTVTLIFFWLFVAFRSAREPVLILVNVALGSLVGGFGALLLTGQNFSVSSGVGFLALFGVSVQAGVILVTYINLLRERGVPLEEAITQSVDLRLRPIMMTALVDTLGLLPAAVSTGIGSDSQKPLAIVIVGGLVTTLILSLVTLPVLYRLFPPRLRVHPDAPPVDPEESLPLAPE